MKIQERTVSKFEIYFSVLSMIFFSGAILPMIQAITTSQANDSNLTMDANEGNVYIQYVFIGVYFITLILIFSKNRRLKEVFKGDLSIKFLFLMIIMSIAWSQFPMITTRRIVGIFGTTLFGYYLSSRFSLESNLKIFARACFIMAILSLATAVVYPKFGIMTGEHQGRLRGVFLHKNTLGGIMCLYSICAFSLAMLTKQNKYLLHIVLATVLIILAQSAGSLVVVVSLMVFGYLLRIIRIPLQGLFSILAILLAIFIMSYFYIYNNYDVVLQVLGRDATLTGRTLLWAELAKWVDKSPLLGYGFGGFWTGDIGISSIVIKKIGWAAPHAHNGFLNLTLELGYVGLALFLICYLSNFYSYLLNCMVNQQLIYSWGILFFSLLLIYNMDECTILRANQIYWVLFIYTISFYRKLKDQPQTNFTLVAS